MNTEFEEIKNRKIRILLKTSITVNEISELFDISIPNAIKLRSKAIDLCKKENLFLTAYKVPTTQVLEAAGMNINEFIKKFDEQSALLNA